MGPRRDHAVAVGLDQFSWKRWRWGCDGEVVVRRRRVRRSVEILEGSIVGLGLGRLRKGLRGCWDGGDEIVLGVVKEGLRVLFV